MMNALTALKNECRHSYKYCYSSYRESDKSMLMVGPLTYEIAEEMSPDGELVESSVCFKQLEALSRQGLVSCLKSIGKPTRWWPVGFLSELQAEPKLPH